LAQACHLAVLVKIDRQNTALLDGGRKKRDLPFGLGNIIPGIAAKGRRSRGIAQLCLHAGLGIVARIDAGFDGLVLQITTLVGDRGTGDQQAGGANEKVLVRHIHS
jgi:hypothetical protein